MRDVRAHPWFASIEWDTLEEKECQPPFVPDVSLFLLGLVVNTDRIVVKMKSANFDVSHELDEFLMVEKPLTHTKRKANADLDKLKPELRQLEEK
jgi:serine/threonine kinase 32